MQISKFPLWLCALTLCGGLTLHAEDTAAQAAARAALLQKMQQLGGNTATTPETSAPTKVAPAQTESPAVTTPAPAATAPATAVTTAPATEAPMATGTGDTPAQAAARAAVEQKLQQMGGNVPATSTTTPGVAPAHQVAAERQIVAPPPPIKMSKLDKLHWLNSLYRSGSLSPEQYQQQRAAIMEDK